MKKLAIILLIAATSNILRAQDTIYTKSGTVIAAKVYEVTQNEIRYQKATNLEGPIYTIDKTNVSLIEYKNGTKDVFSGNQPQTTQPNANNNTYNKDGSYYSDDVYNQGELQPTDVTTNNYYSSSGYYNSGASISFMFGMPSLFWGIPYYAGPWGGWPYYRPYYQSYWANGFYHHPWGGYAYGGWRGGYYNGWRGGYRGGNYGPRGGYGWRGGNHTAHIGGGYSGGPRGGNGGFHGGNGGYHGGNGGGGGFHGGGGGGSHGGGGFHGGGGHGHR